MAAVAINTREQERGNKNRGSRTKSQPHGGSNMVMVQPSLLLRESTRERVEPRGVERNVNGMCTTRAAIVITTIITASIITTATTTATTLLPLMSLPPTLLLLPLLQPLLLLFDDHYCYRHRYCCRYCCRYRCRYHYCCRYRYRYRYRCRYRCRYLRVPQPSRPPRQSRPPPLRLLLLILLPPQLQLTLPLLYYSYYSYYYCKTPTCENPLKARLGTGDPLLLASEIGIGENKLVGANK